MVVNRGEDILYSRKGLQSRGGLRKITDDRARRTAHSWKTVFILEEKVKA
jgi:hypothetical protein